MMAKAFKDVLCRRPEDVREVREDPDDPGRSREVRKRWGGDHSTAAEETTSLPSTWDLRASGMLVAGQLGTGAEEGLGNIKFYQQQYPHLK